MTKLIVLPAQDAGRLIRSSVQRTKAEVVQFLARPGANWNYQRARRLARMKARGALPLWVAEAECQELRHPVAREQNLQAVRAIWQLFDHAEFMTFSLRPRVLSFAPGLGLSVTPDFARYQSGVPRLVTVQYRRENALSDTVAMGFWIEVIAAAFLIDELARAELEIADLRAPKPKAPRSPKLLSGPELPRLDARDLQDTLRVLHAALRELRDDGVLVKERNVSDEDVIPFA